MKYCITCGAELPNNPPVLFCEAHMPRWEGWKMRSRIWGHSGGIERRRVQRAQGVVLRRLQRRLKRLRALVHRDVRLKAVLEVELQKSDALWRSLALRPSPHYELEAALRAEGKEP